MINILLTIAEVLISYLLLLLLSKKYKIDGIYVFAIIATFISCIMNLKQISIMNIGVPIGFGITTSILIGGNIITQKRGNDELKTYLLLIFITILTSCIILNLSSSLTNSKYSLDANNSFNSIFNSSTRLDIALCISILLATWINSKLYYTIKKIQNKIILSNVFSMIITEFIENIIFVLAAYLFNYPIIDLMLCIIFRYTIKTLIGIMGTVPIYIANKNN